jgi:hypothetical protein
MISGANGPPAPAKPETVTRVLTRAWPGGFVSSYSMDGSIPIRPITGLINPG